MDEFEVECLFSDCNNQSEIALKFLELSQSIKTCTTLRDSNCIPLIVQIIYSDSDEDTRQCAFLALQNVVEANPHDETRQMEANVLRHIEPILEYCDSLTSYHNQCESFAEGSDRHPVYAIGNLTKFSFDEDHRRAMVQFGALQAIANLVSVDHVVHGHDSTDEHCLSIRRYGCMALTNLTFNDSNNKSLLFSNRELMEVLVAQLDSTADDLLEVTAGLLRNLSWGADNNVKTVLNEIGTVAALSIASMKSKNENTLNALLSVLWNLSAHSSTNKAELCAVDGMLAFLVDMLVCEGPSHSLRIVENAGGILRNVSSNISDNEIYRKIVRERNGLSLLLKHLSSESLTVVINAVGTLWNLSAGCHEDQQFLLDNNAESIIGLLVHSKYKMISNGCSAVVKNLLNFRRDNRHYFDTIMPVLPTPTTSLPSLQIKNQLELDDEKSIENVCASIINDNRRIEPVETNYLEADAEPKLLYYNCNLDKLSKIALQYAITTNNSVRCHRLECSLYVICFGPLGSYLKINSDEVATSFGTDPPDKRSRSCEES